MKNREQSEHDKAGDVEYSLGAVIVAIVIILFLIIFCVIYGTILFLIHNNN